MIKVAIIGAGISGLFFANLLRKVSDYDVTVFEKNNSIDLDKGYGIQLSTNSIKLLNTIGFNQIDKLKIFNPSKVDFYSIHKKEKICDLNISEFNSDNCKYTTLQRSTLIEFLKEKLPSNLIQFNKKIKNFVNDNKIIKLEFENGFSDKFDYLIISDGVFSSTKSLVTNRYTQPKFFNSVALRGTINKQHLKNIDHNNISLFLGSNLHWVTYPVDKANEFNFIGILEKNLTKDQLNDYSLFNNKNFISLIIKEFSDQVKLNILGNIRNIKCFPIFISNKIDNEKYENVFLIGDAFFAFSPSFAQGGSNSIETAFELSSFLDKNIKDFKSKRIKRTNMINIRSKFNYFSFHLSNSFLIFIRNFIMSKLVKNKKFLESYLGKIYKN